jgi:hypothetical protein
LESVRPCYSSETKLNKNKPNTQQKMKAIKINVQDKSFSIVNVNKLEDYYREIGNGCHTFAVPITFDNLDSIYCDDEGLYNENIGAFVMSGWQYPLVGNAVVVGTDEEGNSVDVKTTIDWLKQRVKFIDKDSPALISYFDRFN